MESAENPGEDEAVSERVEDHIGPRPAGPRSEYPGMFTVSEGDWWHEWGQDVEDGSNPEQYQAGQQALPQ